MRTARLADAGTVFAPDGSRIRELVAVAGGSMVHCTLPLRAVSKAVVHATVMRTTPSPAASARSRHGWFGVRIRRMSGILMTCRITTISSQPTS